MYIMFYKSHTEGTLGKLFPFMNQEKDLDWEGFCASKKKMKGLWLETSNFQNVHDIVLCQF